MLKLASIHTLLIWIFLCDPLWASHFATTFKTKTIHRIKGQNLEISDCSALSFYEEKLLVLSRKEGAFALMQDPVKLIQSSPPFDISGAFLAIDKNSFLAASLTNHEVRKLDNTLTSSTPWLTKGDGPYQCYFPRDAALGKEGEIYIADYGNLRVQEFSKTLEFQKTFVYADPETGQLSAPKSVAVFFDFLFVLYPAQNKILKFQRHSARFIEEFSLKKELDPLQEPFQIRVSPDAVLYVTIPQANQVLAIDIKTKETSTLPDEKFNTAPNQPGPIFVHDSGNLFVGELESPTVHEFQRPLSARLAFLAKKELETGNPKQALDLYKQLLEHSPRNFEALQNILTILKNFCAQAAKNKDLNALEKFVEDILLYSPGDVFALKTKRKILFEKHKHWMLKISIGSFLLFLALTLFPYFKKK